MPVGWCRCAVAPGCGTLILGAFLGIGAILEVLFSTASVVSVLSVVLMFEGFAMVSGVLTWALHRDSAALLRGGKGPRIAVAAGVWALHVLAAVLFLVLFALL